MRRQKQKAVKGKRGILNGKKFVVCLLTAILVTEIVLGKELETNAAEKVNIDLFARAAVLMDGDSGRVLYGKEEDLILPMASTTKIMTCILALENGKPEDTVTVSSYAASMPKVHLGMRSGENYRLEDLLYSLMLESHNDTAVAIAEAIAGDVEHFAVMMNEKAKEIGCQNTCFVTPNGLDRTVQTEEGEKIHSTTATDLARIMRYCVMQSPKKEEFLRITQTGSKCFSDIEQTRSFQCTNHNAFLQMMDGAISGKTGFTGNAGYCYVCALQRDDRTFIVSLLACGWPNHKTYKWSDTRKLMEYGLENYSYQEFSPKSDLEQVNIHLGIAEDGNPFKERNVETQCELAQKSIRLLVRKDEKVIAQTRYEKQLDAPVKAGDPVGDMRFVLIDYTGKKYEIMRDKIYIKDSVEKIGFRHYLFYMIQEYAV